MGFSAILDHWSALLAFGPRRQQPSSASASRRPIRSHKTNSEISSFGPGTSSNPLVVDKQSNSSHSRKRSAPIYIHGDDEQHQPAPKKIKFDLAHNKTVEFKKTAAPRSITPAIINTAEENHEYTIDDGFCMSGALTTSSPPRSNANKRVRSLKIQDDACVARSDVHSGVAAMPFKILDSQDLFGLKLFIGPFPWKLLIGFNTTFLGVQRALDHARQTILSGEAVGMSYDEILIDALAKRGGTSEGQKKVKYVEDMIAVINWDDGAWDEEYWNMVWSKSSFWEGRSEAFKEATQETIDEPV